MTKPTPKKATLRQLEIYLRIGKANDDKGPKKTRFKQVFEIRKVK